MYHYPKGCRIPTLPQQRYRKASLTMQTQKSLPSMTWALLLVCTAFLVPATSPMSNKTSCPTYTPSTPQPIDLVDLPSIYANASKSQNADTVAQILNTLSLYPFAIDGKNFAALSLVFTEDVIANYSAPLNILTPLSVVQKSLEQSLAPVNSQHAYGTQAVEVLDSCSARSVSYFTANQFGMGQYAGQVCTSPTIKFRKDSYENEHHTDL